MNVTLKSEHASHGEEELKRDIKLSEISDWNSSTIFQTT